MRPSAFIASALLLLVACGPAREDEEVVSSASDLSDSGRQARYARIRDAAVAHGLDTDYLLAGIAYAETGLAQCWSEATWACAGPNSPDCNGGPVIAGRFDAASCGARAGGLGMFQFDAGDYDDTQRTYGDDVLTVAGQVAHAIDYVVEMVRISDYTTNAETTEKARAWVAGFDPNDAVRRDQWVKTVLRYYNGCEPGWSCWNDRYRNYAGGLTNALAETGGVDFWRGTSCPGGGGATIGAIDAKYRALGGCASILGVPITGELGAPDGKGRYGVFARGSIYWTTWTGAHEVHGRIRDEWKERGWEAGALGYPTSDEYDVAAGKRSDFEHGSITWRASSDDFDVAVVP